MERAAGDPKFMSELLQLFSSTERELLDDLTAGVAAGDCPTVRAAAHRLKGALELICAEPAAGLARKLEQEARAQHADASKGGLGRASEEWVALLDALQLEMRRLREALVPAA